MPRDAAHVRDYTCPFEARFSFLTTSFKPDHISSIAQTLMSTRPSGSAISLIVSSVISVGTLDAFFGQETQMAASLFIFFNEVTRAFDNRPFSFENMSTISESSAILWTRVTRSGNGARRARKFTGASYTKILEPSLIPSFFARGVPEYPAIISSDELEL